MTLLGLGLLVAATIALSPLRSEPSPVTFAEPRAEAKWPLTHGHEQEERDDALRRAKVWTAANPAAVNFQRNPPDPSGLLSEPIVRCRYLPNEPHGTTPKFDCVLRDGEVVKVKYGWASAEVHAEVAASHLLAALGFGADDMFFLPRVRCYGCPRFPFEVAETLNRIGARRILARWLPRDRFVDFESVAVERRLARHEIAMSGSAHDEAAAKGWAWWELDRLDPSSGARRAELDALRLMAVFLAHWDNKSSNQRLVCLASPLTGSTAPCPQPFALIHDVGATFGPQKMDIKSWEAKRVWVDAIECRVSMKDMPYGGGTFPDAQISEAGRALLSRQLGALSERQILDLFTSARFDTFRGWGMTTPPVSEWVRVFRAKVADISSAGPCPDRPSRLSP